MYVHGICETCGQTGLMTVNADGIYTCLDCSGQRLDEPDCPPDTSCDQCHNYIHCCT